LGENVERSDAERVFRLVAEIGGDLRGRIVSERWWLVWIVFGLEMLATCTATQLLVWDGERRLGVFGALWSLHLLLIPLIVAVLHRRGGGQRTATEQYLWWIWATFVLCGGAVVLFNTGVGASLAGPLPAVALLAAFAFSILAMVTHRRFLYCSAYFAGVGAACRLLSDGQFLLFGAAWCLLLVALGIAFRLTTRPVSTQRL
jgi:hypothetical protein